MKSSIVKVQSSKYFKWKEASLNDVNSVIGELSNSKEEDIYSFPNSLMKKKVTVYKFQWSTSSIGYLMKTVSIPVYKKETSHNYGLIPLVAIVPKIINRMSYQTTTWEIFWDQYLAYTCPICWFP